jgi:putative Mg2+ transporter-C (MgtC) family protein
MDWLTQLQVIGEVALAMVLGGVIGIERELANKPAGSHAHASSGICRAPSWVG